MKQFENAQECMHVSTPVKPHKHHSQLAISGLDNIQIQFPISIIGLGLDLEILHAITVSSRLLDLKACRRHEVLNTSLVAQV